MNPQYLALNGGTPNAKSLLSRTADCHNLIDAERPALSLQQRRPSATSRVRGSGHLSPRDDVFAWPRGVTPFGAVSHTADDAMAGLSASLPSSWAIHSALREHRVGTIVWIVTVSEGLWPTSDGYISAHVLHGVARATRLSRACRNPQGSPAGPRRRRPDLRHAEFRRENGEYLIVDTGSLNGTYVNRKPAESVALANGDEIQVGKFRLVFLTRPTTH